MAAWWVVMESAEALGTADARGGGRRGRTVRGSPDRGATAGIREDHVLSHSHVGGTARSSPASCYQRFEVLWGCILGRAFHGRGS